MTDHSCYKYDYLALTTLDIQATTFELLQKDGVIPKELTLKECFRKYINPNTIDYEDPHIWDILYDDLVLSVFQWDKPSGRHGVLSTKPRNLDDLTAVNALIRLMTEEGQEDQIERFNRIKENPKEFEIEMLRAGLSEEQRQIMHEVLGKYNGVAAMQESFMILSRRLAGYSEGEADALRKIVAKKKMAEITTQKEKFFKRMMKNGSTQSAAEYCWRVTVQPSLGYGSDELGPYTPNCLTSRVAHCG